MRIYYLEDLVVKSATLCYERYFDCQDMKNWPVMFYL